jgi:hypothetical protein
VAPVRIVYTYHAKKRMGQRKVTSEQVEEVLAWPDDTLPGEWNEEIAIKRFGVREVKVVYEEDSDRDVVVVYTVISRRLKGRGNRSDR